MATKKLSFWNILAGRKSRDVNCYISYSRSDGQLYASRLSDSLNEAGINILGQGGNQNFIEDWVSNLRRYMEEADIVIFVVTPKAVLSSIFSAEVEFCIDRNIRLFPILFGGFSYYNDMSNRLRDFQAFLEKESTLRDGPSPRALASLIDVIEGLRSGGPRGFRDDSFLVNLEKRPLNEGKLILVGRGEVGKTSLVKRLVEGGFDGDESKTQGIKITRWLIPDASDALRLNIWDFGGQEIMHATHQFFMTERSLYLLVLNGREGGEDVDAEYWLKHIVSFGGESPVIVVQNKISQHPFDLNYRGMLARYPQIRDFIKTDCKDEIGLSKLRELIESIVGGMPEVRMQFPSDWFAVKNRLELMDEEYLGYQGFIDLCMEEGVGREADRDALGFVLHCLGIALNYRDDVRLRETSVLKPEWVTQGIYQILNAKELADRQGELELKELQDILPKNRYPLDKNLFLLELMRKFSLCFPFRDEADRYLIPELLGKEEPAEVLSFAPESCLNFEYHYGILPEGLLPRFIVRTHTLSRGQQRWRSGVVLSYEDCRALVKAEPIERQVLVRVKGGDAGSRRNLLAIIRYDLDRIHAEFKDRLDAQAKVPLAEFPAFSIDYKKLVAFEHQGVKEFPEFIGHKVIEVHVKELLNGVDFAEQVIDSFDALDAAKSIFFSYSHKDEGLRDELETHLKLLQRQRIISTWHDRKILLGSEWDREIDQRLEQAALVLLLVSADFIASDYCWDKEVERAMERHAAKEAIVVPVLLRSCDWKSAPFGKLQGLPTGMKAVTAWSDRDAAWTNVATGIRALAESLRRVS